MLNIENSLNISANTHENENDKDREICRTAFRNKRIYNSRQSGSRGQQSYLLDSKPNFNARAKLANNPNGLSASAVEPIRDNIQQTVLSQIGRKGIRPRIKLKAKAHNEIINNLPSDLTREYKSHFKSFLCIWERDPVNKGRIWSLPKTPKQWEQFKEMLQGDKYKRRSKQIASAVKKIVTPETVSFRKKIELENSIHWDIINNLSLDSANKYRIKIFLFAWEQDPVNKGCAWSPPKTDEEWTQFAEMLKRPEYENIHQYSLTALKKAFAPDILLPRKRIELKNVAHEKIIKSLPFGGSRKSRFKAFLSIWEKEHIDDGCAWSPPKTDEEFKKLKKMLREHKYKNRFNGILSTVKEFFSFDDVSSRKNIKLIAEKRKKTIKNIPSGLEIIKQIKQEQPGKQEQHEPSVTRTLKREIDNNGYILRNPNDPSKKAEIPEENIRIYWYDFRDKLNKKTKENIKKEIKKWIDNENNGSHQVFFDDMLSVENPLDDDPERGDSLFAKRYLPKFTVLGPYAGLLHDDKILPNSLSQDLRKHGTSNVSTYAFGTLSASRLISAYSSGNVLSLMNTATLPGYAPLLGKKNNVSAVTVGKNMVFFITNTDIKKGEELFLDYGPDYEPRPNVKKLKQENLDDLS